MARSSTSGIGRPKGIPNKITTEFKQTITDLLAKNDKNVEKWLKMVAEGHGDKDADPGKALDLVFKLAEYAYPKLARTELTGKDGAPISVGFKTVYEK